MRLLNQIILAALFAVKIVVGCLFIYQVGFELVPLERAAIASEVATNAEGAERPAHNQSGATEPQKHGIGAGPSTKTQEDAIEDEELDLDFLIQKMAQLEKREERIEKERKALLAIQNDINGKIATLSQLRDEIRAEIERKKTFDESRLRHIVKAYSAMKPQKAASLIEKLDLDFAVELLSNMKGDVVGNILSFIDTQKAATISEELARRQ
jgi:flagellar motility protein MotE (MotC chaperone)